MKRITILFVLAAVAVMFLCTASSRREPFDYNGTWVVGTPDGARFGGELYFYVKLKQDGDDLTGTYYSISQKNARRDVNPSNSVSGYAKRKYAVVEFSSTEWGGGGVAELRPVDKNTLSWHIVSEKKVGNADFGHWAPNRARLTRK
ncbi:MAG: hypothetical protein J5526_07430 [Bacteroidales bacterium]|nr:hypothetical protein [Bacteroidales bacterium]